GVCCGATGGGAEDCGVGCVVCAKPNGRKQTKPASSNLKERFLIMRVNSGSVFNGNNKWRRLPLEQRKPLKYGGKEGTEECYRTEMPRILCFLRPSAFQGFGPGKKGDLRF
ncbi:MAG TPA: hypothetical protein VH024_13085, partial [Candidatus Angelobacter sp.]|nr:hypothetical protein [Candidatus Angelobacter sp.]